MRETAIFPLPV